ncbi:MAG: FAD-dependent oxidoreductase, partial [Bacteroidota bacterium]
MQHEVIIVGGGLAGITAALELLDQGKRVALLDRGPKERFGGLARWAMGGIFYVDSPFQRKAKIQDSPEKAYRDWLSYAEFGAGDEWPRRWAEQYVSRCTPEVYEWLKPKGIKYIPSVQWIERGLHQPGNSVPRFHVVWGTGQALADQLIDALWRHPNRKRLELFFRQDVEDLLLREGRVIGVRGHQLDGGAAFEIEAETVIIAAGGITGDVKVVRKHWDPAWGEAPNDLLTGSHLVANGDIHRIVESHGAQLSNLHHQWNYAAGVHHPDADHAQHGLSLVPPKTALWV